MSALGTVVTVYLYDGSIEEHPDALSWNVTGEDATLRLEVYDESYEPLGTYKHGTWSHVRRVPVETIQTPSVGAGAAADGGHDAGEASSSLSQPAGVEGVGAPSAMGEAPAPISTQLVLSRFQINGVQYVQATCPCGEWFRWRRFEDGITGNARWFLSDHILHVDELPGRPGAVPSFEQAFAPADGGEECRS